jgi:hypothetical protein
MTAVVDGTARLGRVVHGTQILPFGGAHFRAGDGGARRVVCEERDDDRVDPLDKEATELIQPQCPIHVLWWLNQLQRHIPVHCYCAIRADWVRQEVV